MNLAEWKAAVTAKHPSAEFTCEDGSGRSYGDVGEWTAHTGPDMQADVVGVFVPGEFCDIWGPAVLEFDGLPGREYQDFAAE